MGASAAQIKELREVTGLGMLDCKKALVEAEGDLQKAVDILRKASGAKAGKKAGRIAANGLIRLSVSGGRGFLLEVNCETDFASGSEDFSCFADEAMDALVRQGNDDIELLLAGGFERRREALVQKIGENVQIRRAAILVSSGVIGSYLHNGRIGVLVAMTAAGEELQRDIAMHVAAASPLVVSQEQVPQELIAREREIYMAQAEQSGKPEAIVQKMVDGRLRKYLSEVSLLEQPFVRDQNQKVGNLLKAAGTQVESFIRFEVGEGMEIETTDFATEVAAQLQ